MNNGSSSNNVVGWRSFPPDFSISTSTRRSITKSGGGVGGSGVGGGPTLFQSLPPANGSCFHVGKMGGGAPPSFTPASQPHFDSGRPLFHSSPPPPTKTMHSSSTNPSNRCSSFDSNGFLSSSSSSRCDYGYNRSLSEGISPPPKGLMMMMAAAATADDNGSSSPPPMQIGTWNSGADEQAGNSFPTVSTFEIGTFNSTTGVRETGIIEKLLHSYGFIQCCDRQARLFFHFSQFDGNIEHLKIGDPVEFEMTYDRRTGKPIASAVSKISPDVVMSEERVMGTVTTEASLDPDTKNVVHGRISYENRGECFFLPFTPTDVEGNVTITSGDKVSFQVATMQRTGNLVARTIRLENPVAPVKYRGVVNSIKDSFGFIERSDVVKEIFFHMSESNDAAGLILGDDVEFTIQTRNSKEVACNIMKLEPGTVVFEDVDNVYFTGQVLKPIDRNSSETDPLPGRVKYRGKDRSEIEIPFGEKDQIGDFTLRHGDWVKFVIAIDRRDKLQRATKIALLDESFHVSDERREQGIIQSLKEGFGFIKCADRDARIFFHFSECLDVSRVLQVGDNCEFTVAKDPAQRLLATRIKHLAPGSVSFDAVIHRGITGRIELEPPCLSRSFKDQHSSNEVSSGGKIVYELNGACLEIPLHANDCDLRNTPRKNDTVSFDINQVKSTKETNAVNVLVLQSDKTSVSSKHVYQGYIAALKDGFGFLETLEHDKEIFFHFSNVEGKVEKLEVGTEVEYRLSGSKDKKVSAEKLKVLPRGTVPQIKAKPEALNGKVVRTLRSVNPDQDQYCGLIQVTSEDGKVLAEYEYGIASLLIKKELLQIRDPVQFEASEDGNFAVNVKATSEKLRATVEAVKGQYGFLSHEVDEGKKLFFHMSEVEAGESLQQGDQVEFVVVTNKRTGKHSACSVKKISSSKRPDRLISRLKTINLENAARGGPKVVVIRQPKGPDGSTGFKSRSSVAALALLDELD